MNTVRFIVLIICYNEYNRRCEYMRKITSSIDTREIALTIYNGGFGAVKEIRTVNMDGNETELVYADVAQKIETDSLIVEGLNIL